MKLILSIVEGNRDIMRRLLAHARERGDAADAGCKTEKLSALDAAVRITNQQRAVLSTALSEGDAIREANAQRQLDGECARAERLRDEASRCAPAP